jgi:hypothetical protein
VWIPGWFPHPSFIMCAGSFGTQHPATASASWDAVTLSGMETLNDTGVCGGTAGVVPPGNFTLRNA